MLCFKDQFCKSCDSNGKCLTCHENHKLASSGKCVCSSISNCEDCAEDVKKCNKCNDGLKLNTAASPETCVATCPSGTHESNLKCFKGSNYVALRSTEKYYSTMNPDVYNRDHPMMKNIIYPTNS